MVIWDGVTPVQNGGTHTHTPDERQISAEDWRTINEYRRMRDELARRKHDCEHAQKRMDTFGVKLYTQICEKGLSHLV